MKRREFIALLGGAEAAWPLAGRAATGNAGDRIHQRRLAWPIRVPVRAFHEGLGETGYVEGQNLAIEFRWAERQND